MGRRNGKDEEMRFMLLQHYGGVESDGAPMYEWSPEEGPTSNSSRR